LNFGPRILELADRLAVYSELPGALACTYLTPAHRATASELAQWMRDAGMAVETTASPMWLTLPAAARAQTGGGLRRTRWSMPANTMGGWASWPGSW
jgi:hypothetical protein